MEINIQYGIAQTIYFTMVDAGTNDLAVSGDWTPASGDCNLIKDGGSTAEATNTIAPPTQTF